MLTVTRWCDTIQIRNFTIEWQRDLWHEMRLGVFAEAGLYQDWIKILFLVNCCDLVFQYEDQNLL